MGVGDVDVIVAPLPDAGTEGVGGTVAPLQGAGGTALSLHHEEGTVTTIAGGTVTVTTTARGIAAVKTIAMITTVNGTVTVMMTAGGMETGTKKMTGATRRAKESRIMAATATIVTTTALETGIEMMMTNRGTIKIR
mmetsp:Transcript_28905/g.70462  ORF Transcript_28905/g.70462 Transcript_28905/m.70462 type:complete len:137 (+) Transcript_28905:381-791(+)